MDISIKVKEIMAEQLGIEIKNVNGITTLKDLGADSLDKLEITLQLEDKFKIKIPDDEAEKLLTVGDVINYIEEKINK